MRTKDYADVAVKPAVLFLGALAAGFLLTRYAPIGPGFASASKFALKMGSAFVVVGVTLALFPVRRLIRAGTSVMPGEPATVLVRDGAYAVTRNPMYIGFILFCFGLSIALTSVWLLLLLIPVVMILHRGVVLREEAYLEWKFGDDYRRYADRVPRWL